MHSAKTAYETIELLWNNYLALAEQVDLEAMDHQTRMAHARNKQPVRPFRIATWLARQGYFIAAWGLWEYYSHEVCDSLENKDRRHKSESHVQWVSRSLKANGLKFPDSEWFSSANCLRNLIAHCGARVVGQRAEKLFDRGHLAFPSIETCKDGYADITHCQVADLQEKIVDFIEAAADYPAGPDGEPQTEG